MKTVETILPILQFLAGPGSGVAAFYLVNALRSHFPQPYPHGGTPPSPQWHVRFAYQLLYTPRYGRISAMVLAAHIAVTCSTLVAFLTGADVGVALDLAISASMAVGVNAIMRARTRGAA